MAMNEVEPRDDVVARYRALREISIGYHGRALRLVSNDAILAQARRLGLTVGKTIVADEDDIDYVFDLLNYTAAPGRSRTIDRLARSSKAIDGSDDALVLCAMQQARFSLWRIERRHETAGLVVHDLVREVDVWLMDDGLEQTAQEGSVIGARLFSPEGFAMTSGVPVVLDTDLLLDVLDACASLGGRPDAAVIEDRRFATALYRLALKRDHAADASEWAA